MISSDLGVWFLYDSKGFIQELPLQTPPLWLLTTVSSY